MSCAEPQLTVRPLTSTNAAASLQLGQEAFGVPTTQPTEHPPWPPAGTHPFGTFDGKRLAARMIDKEYDSHFGGALLPTSGIAGVTVQAEYRGRGLLTDLFRHTLESAKDRGATLSTLFPTAARIYRRFGYELVGDFATVQVPSWVLGFVHRPADVHTRRATEADVDAIRDLYESWASAQNGPLCRRGPIFRATPTEFLAGFTGVTVAVDDDGDEMCGFACWDRGQGYGETATLSVSDVIASTAGGYQALLSALGSFSSVTASTRIDTSGAEVIRTFLPTVHWETVDTSPYMLKVLDVCGALNHRRYPALEVELGFRLAGDFLEENNGCYAVAVGAGQGECRRVHECAGPTFTPRGLAQLFAGTQSCANLRTAGLLSGRTDADSSWDALFGGRQFHIRDYF